MIIVNAFSCRVARLLYCNLGLNGLSREIQLAVPLKANASPHDWEGSGPAVVVPGTGCNSPQQILAGLAWYSLAVGYLLPAQSTPFAA